jgi:vacuolar-type H+-ATPase subunit H
MTAGTNTPTGTPATAAGDLALLVNTEQALEAAIVHAREESTKVVDEARRRVAGIEAALETELREMRERFASDVEAECRRRAAEILEGAQRQAAAFDGISAKAIEELATAVLRRVAGEAPR